MINGDRDEKKNYDEDLSKTRLKCYDKITNADPMERINEIKEIPEMTMQFMQERKLQTEIN